MQAFNLFAYCSNNPVMYVDPNGHIIATPTSFMWSSVELLMLFLLGDGENLTFSENSSIARALKSSGLMNDKINQHIEEYKKTGKSHFEGEILLKGITELDLWLGVRWCRYEIDIYETTHTEGWWIFKRTYTDYVVNVTVFDTYDFNQGTDKGDGVFSILNNFGYLLEEKGYGKTFTWSVSYTKTYCNHRKNSNFIVYFPIFL